MIEHTYNEQLLQRYLLGELSEAERESLQESYFVDAGLFSRLLSAEADLIDAYERGELTAAERERFEQRFGNSRGIDQRLNFASMLSRAADQHATNTPARLPAWEPRPLRVNAPSPGFPGLSSIRPSVGSRVVRASLLAIAAVIVLTAALVAANRWPPWVEESGVELARSQTDSPTGSSAQSNTAATPGRTDVDDESRSSEAPPAIKSAPNRRAALPKAQLASISVVLREGMTRKGGQTTEVVLSPSTRSVQTQLEVPAEVQTKTYSSYQAVLQTVSGEEVVRRDRLKISRGSSGSVVRVNIPAELLTTRDYVVLLSGQRSDGTHQYLRGYSFTVLRK